MVRRSLGSTTNNLLIRSFGASKIYNQLYKKYPLSKDAVAGNLPDISAHSGDVNVYFPSIIFRSITICLRCQKGGQPTSLQ